MPPRKATTAHSRGTRTPTRAASRDVVAESTHEVGQPAAQQVDIEAVRQIAQEAARQAAQDAVQQIAQEVARVAAQEAARVAAQEIAHQAALETEQVAAQHAQQAVAQPDQVDGHAALMEELMRYRERFGDQLHGDVAAGVAPQGVRVQQDAAPFVEHVPYPPPPPPVRHHQGPTYWELMRQMRDMGLEMFGGSTNAIAADNWRRKLERNLDHMRCPAEHRLDLTTQYLKEDALVWWEGIAERNHGRYELTYGDFKMEFTKKYFPQETMDEKENAFQDICQGTRTVREYELEFSRLRRFARRVMDEEELIRRFMKGLRVEVRNRCSLVDYRSMVELVEKAAIQEAGLAEEQRLTRGTQLKQGRAPETQKRSWGQTGPPQCHRCHRNHTGACNSCYICGKLGHIARNCRSQLGAAPKSCFNCG